MRRRTSIIIFGGAVALPLQDADSATGPVVGFLSTALPASLASFVSAVLQGLRQVGFIDGQNAAVNVSGYDAVDGSSTGSRVPRMWALFRLPRFRAAHADYHDNRSRHRQVGLPGSRR